ncbi:transcription factor MYB124-like isoform X2 [Rhodamnia argentea]|uniref:Transcription factor MYB124-like isoform X2 n=1 Tax=Rhodamnia argentea TaxID=178133 RepID=A0A8B8QPK1_9MYRT|nr:transcription factor MYB124-like isoform X2 [Rhodamnia argentea]
MQEMKRECDGGGNNGDVKKERHIVTWSQQEDDTLREQITIHGTDNWVTIASKFKDKTARQCRRRWYTYLNSDFKKGGWSPEEDMLLCEAQKIFGNRWTEISKVVSGRTDNAVKNRFTTLCKKRAKYESLTKENNFPFINTNNKRVVSYNTSISEETSERAVHLKRMRRTQVPDLTEACNFGMISYGKSRVALDQQPRTPFSVVVSNIHNNYAAKDSKTERTFLSKDDPKVTALMQQAELLGSLALKVNTESTCQSLENAWKVLEDFLNQAKGGEFHEHMISNIDFQQENFKDLLKELGSSIEGSQSSREPDLCEASPASSEYSTGSTILLHGTTDGTEPTQQRGGILDKYVETETAAPPIHTEQFVNDQNVTIPFHHTTNKAENPQSIDEQINENGVGPALSHTEFGSPLQVTPLFGSLAAGIPSPKFSESEKNFIMKTLGMESPRPIPSINPSHPPACKRALLQNP